MEQQSNKLLPITVSIPPIAEFTQPPAPQQKPTVQYIGISLIIFFAIGFLGLVVFRAIYSSALVLLPTALPAGYEPVDIVQKQGPADFGQVYVRGEQMFIYAQRPLPSQLICKKPAPDSAVSDYVTLAIPGAVEACAATLQTAGGYQERVFSLVTDVAQLAVKTKNQDLTDAEVIKILSSVELQKVRVKQISRPKP